ncbi:hypothetical protein, partial [Micromonospora sp. NPDC005161]
ELVMPVLLPAAKARLHQPSQAGHPSRLCRDPGFQPIAAVLAIVLFACFLILFAVFWVGWLMRGHELWRAERRGARGEDGN